MPTNFVSPFQESGSLPFLDNSSPDGRESVGLIETPSSIQSGDISGGSTSSAVAQASEQIEEFISDGGGLLAIVYGENFIAGNLILHKFTAGTPNTSIIYVGLGEGQGDGGDIGEWDGALTVYYAGATQSVSPNGSTAGYRFHNGYISTDVTTGNQPVDAFLTNGLAYSGTAYIAVKLTDAVANAEDRPDKIRGRYKGRRLLDFGIVGNVNGYGYSANPAREAVDRILAYYQRKTGDTTQARIKLYGKIDWETWRGWADYNDATISWDNGTSTVSIPRFEGHMAFTQDAILADALDQICAAAGAWWQDEGEQIVFLAPIDRTPVHHFDESNIITGTINLQPRDLRERPNYFVAQFRDYDDPFLGMTSVEVRREELIRQVGEIKSVRAFPNMRQSQAQRLLERQARLEADNPNIVTLIGDETSIHLLHGDFVTLSHPLGDWEYQLCLVLSVSLTSAEQSTDTCEVALQVLEDSLYSDAAHGPRQEALTP